MRRARIDRPFMLGEWLVDLETGELRRDDETTRLEPKVAEVLRHLVQADGDIVSKDILLECVWGGIAVSNDVLRRCIYSLRNTLGDDPEEPRYIRTLPRRGYCLVADIYEPGGKPVPRPSPRPAPSTVRPGSEARRRFAGSGGTRIAAAAAVGALLISSPWIYRAAAGDVGQAAETVVQRLSATASETAGEDPLLPTADPAPRSADEFYKLGKTFAERRGDDDFERAITLLRRAIAMDPDHAPARALLSNTYSLSVGGYYRDPARLDLAVSQADRAIALDPSLPEAHKALGLALASKGWLTQAAAAYERAIALRPDYSAPVHNLSLIYSRRGHLDDALALQRQLRSPNLTRAIELNNLGYTYRLLLLHDDARRHFNAGLDISPQHALLSVNLAFVELIEGNESIADELIRSAIDMHPNDPRLLAAAGRFALMAGNPTDARDRFEASTARSADWTNGISHLGLAYLRWTDGDLETAQRTFDDFFEWDERVRRERREGPSSAFNLAAIHAVQARIDEAFAELARAIDGGFVDVELLERLPYYDSLRGDERYVTTVAELRRRIAEMQERVAGQERVAAQR